MKIPSYKKVQIQTNIQENSESEKQTHLCQTIDLSD